MIEMSYDNPVLTSCETSLDISQDTLCSGKSFSVIISFLLFGILFDEKTS